MVVEEPLQTAVAIPTPGVGSGFTVTNTESVLLQPEAVIVSLRI